MKNIPFFCEGIFKAKINWYHPIVAHTFALKKGLSYLPLSYGMNLITQAQEVVLSENILKVQCYLLTEKRTKIFLDLIQVKRTI